MKVVAQGTGQALDTARRGDADVVFVHAKSAEEKFLSEGFGVKRYPVMYNDFVLIGPKGDPAGIKGSKDIVAALKTIKDKAAPFISRGDRSPAPTSPSSRSGRRPASTSRRTRAPGTRRSARAWAPRSTPRRRSNGYVLSDRGTWLSFKNRGDSRSWSKATSGCSTNTASCW